MRPAARVQAAIEVLDHVLAGKPAEQALTGWARGSRYAGSKDRAAVRDHVFDAMRCQRSFAALGGDWSGRGLMLGALRQAEQDVDSIFCGDGYGPGALTPEEQAPRFGATPTTERLDVPDWLWPRFVDSLGDQAEAAAVALQSRAPVHLRVNLRRASREDVQQSLIDDGILCAPHPASPSALEVLEGNRRIRQNSAYLEGLIELQDAASQAVVDALPLGDGMRVLDFCAGGGGKSLAIAALADVQVFAHDALPRRMRDLPDRAQRAGVTITEIPSDEIQQAGPFDIVLCDAPCSGSGAWRRAPEGKWQLNEERLGAVITTQAEILQQATQYVSSGGLLAYVTCSIFNDENANQVDSFLALNIGWQQVFQHSWALQNGTDGFFTAHLTRTAA